MTDTPRGCNRCASCGAVSKVYELWATCRDCQNDCCQECAVRGSYECDEGRPHVTCPDCGTECAHCDVKPATKFLEPDDPRDQCCDSCHARLYTECPACQRIVFKDDLVDVCVSRQTRWEPAEYETRCIDCAPDEPDEHYEAEGRADWARDDL